MLRTTNPPDPQHLDRTDIPLVITNLAGSKYPVYWKMVQDKRVLFSSEAKRRQAPQTIPNFPYTAGARQPQLQFIEPDPEARRYSYYAAMFVLGYGGTVGQELTVGPDLQQQDLTLVARITQGTPLGLNIPVVVYAYKEVPDTEVWRGINHILAYLKFANWPTNEQSVPMLPSSLALRYCSPGVLQLGNTLGWLHASPDVHPHWWNIRWPEGNYHCR